MTMNVSPAHVHTNSETASFINEQKLVIYKACKDSILRRCDWDVVVNSVARKYSKGQIEYNPARGKYSTFVYAVAKNCAIDELRRQHPERFQNMDDKEWGNVHDEHDDYSHTVAGDRQVIGEEALRRLTSETRDKTKVEILVRFVLNGEKREELAEEYRVEGDYVSLVKTRYLPRLQKLVGEVMKEDEEGNLTLSNTDIGYLKPYLNW